MQYQLLMCSRQPIANTSDFEYVPPEGQVKAVGVWDTVGSLGIPEMPPFYHSGRAEKEVRCSPSGKLGTVD
jgi:hypothetical protein